MRSDITDRFLKKQRSMEYPYTIDALGFEIRIDKDVYPASEDSTVLAEQLENGDYRVRCGERVLDFGTGTGYFALVAARAGGRVVAIDINPAAIKCAQYNALKHGFKNMVDLRHGSFGAIREGEKFDVVTTSLPFEAAKPLDLLEMSVYDEDFATRREFFARIKLYLTGHGRVFFAYADYVESVAPISDFLEGYNYRLISEKRSKDNELNRVYLITPK